MTDSDFDQVFGAKPAARATFAERVAPPQNFGTRNDAVTAAAIDHLSNQPDNGVYRAFGFIPAGTVNPSCEVRSWMDGTDIADGIVFFYRLLMQIGFTGSNELRLMLPDSIIVLAGRNLEPLRQALTRQQATYIQKYSRRLWQTPIPEGEPFVAQVAIIRP